MNKIIHKDLSYIVYGICFKAHNELGRHRTESIYGDYLAQSLKDLKIPFKREFVLPESFFGEKEGRNIVDFLIDNKIVLDVKAKQIITKRDYHQMKRYLAESGLHLGLIVNFRQKYIHPKRILN